MQDVTANNSIVVADDPPKTTMQFEYEYKPYKTGIVSFSEEDTSLATMIASEVVLARD